MDVHKKNYSCYEIILPMQTVFFNKTSDFNQVNLPSYAECSSASIEFVIGSLFLFLFFILLRPLLTKMRKFYAMLRQGRELNICAV